MSRHIFPDTKLGHARVSLKLSLIYYFSEQNFN